MPLPTPGDRWVGAQLDDFNQGGTAKIGNIASLGGGAGQSIMDSQKIHLCRRPILGIGCQVTLNYVLRRPLGTAPFIHYACP